MHLWYPSSKRSTEWTFLFFRVSLSANVGLRSTPDPFPRKPFPFAPMTFLFAMDEIEAIGEKRDLQFLIFLKRCII